ncbi:MAG: alanine:cation symporter family protein [Dysgonamonadaceae bacterium]|jgi:AGCS family alanine or glycine:cation symporter|nr:alanine:cation symporter family protein [Dysgonamonadaceae bacterium]
MTFSEIVSTASSWVWGIPIIVLLIATGFYFSIRTRFLQVRYFKEMIQMLFQGKSSANGISSFQSFALALSGRVGTGNIAGVATAIALGGPGAVFWMWFIAFFGAGTAYVEASLGQIYKEEIDGHYRGGPAYYILKGLKNKYFAMAFALTTIISLGLLLPGVQSNAICDAFYNSFRMEKPITAGIIVFLLALVIFGGVKRLAKVAEYVTPFMAVGYVLVALVILAINHQHIPSMFALIFKSAFGLEPAMSGVVGAAISMGVKRGVFSNEAGQGTAPHAAAACDVPHPAKQGLVQAFSVYVDTLLVCSATALIILATGMYNVYDTVGNVVFRGGGLPLSETGYGPIFTQMAVDTSIPGLGSAFVSIALFFFAFTTIMSYYFQAESNVYFIFRKKRTAFYMINLLRVAVLFVTFFTAVNAMTLAWNMADIGVGIMAWLNLIALILLQKTALKTFSDFEEQFKSGIKKPVFHPDKLGIENADEWHTVNYPDKS